MEIDGNSYKNCAMRPGSVDLIEVCIINFSIFFHAFSLNYIERL